MTDPYEPETHSEDDLAERSVIGSMLLPGKVAERATDEVMEILTGADFASPRHETIFETIARMRRAGEHSNDPVAVAARLSEAGDLQRVGGAPYLHTLMSTPATAANAAFHARIVAKRAVLRRLANAAMRIRQLATTDGDANEAVEAARAEVDACTRAVADIALVSDRIDASLDALEQPQTAVPTPWPDLNGLIRGWRPGALYVIGARPGVGKSIAAVQAAIDLVPHGHVAFSSLEMPERELHYRMVAALAEVPLGRLDGHEVTQADWNKIAAARQRMAALRISIDDRSTVTPTDIRSHARSLARKGPLAGVIVDYLQLMSAPAADARKPRHEVVAGFSRSLKLLAKELDVPVIALSQLNRASMGRDDKRPTLADLRESGSVEQDADVVLLLHEDEKAETNVQMLVAKNRHGARGAVELERKGWYSRLDARRWSPSRAAS